MAIYKILRLADVCHVTGILYPDQLVCVTWLEYCVLRDYNLQLYRQSFNTKLKICKNRKNPGTREKHSFISNSFRIINQIKSRTTPWKFHETKSNWNKQQTHWSDIIILNRRNKPHTAYLLSAMKSQGCSINIDVLRAN